MSLVKLVLEKKAGMFDTALKAGSKLMNNNILRNTAIGVGVGAIGGAATAKDGQRISGALKGGLLGGVLSGGATMGTNMYKNMKAMPAMTAKQAFSSELKGIRHAASSASESLALSRAMKSPSTVATVEKSSVNSLPPAKQVSQTEKGSFFKNKAGEEVHVDVNSTKAKPQSFFDTHNQLHADQTALKGTNFANGNNVPIPAPLTKAPMQLGPGAPKRGFLSRLFSGN